MNIRQPCRIQITNNMILEEDYFIEARRPI